jgi:hypothetical protein
LLNLIGDQAFSELPLTVNLEQPLPSFSALVTLINQVKETLSSDVKKQFYQDVTQRLILEPQSVLNMVLEAFQAAIGPISEVIYNDVLSEYSSVDFDRFSNLSNFIAELAEEIDIEQYKQQFWASLRQKLATGLPMLFQGLDSEPN